MKCLLRNKREFWYSLYKDKELITDEYGNETGEYKILRGNPQQGFANISAAKGEVSTRLFGDTENYDKVIAYEADAYPIDEYSVLWVDTMPELDEDGALAVDDEGNVITPYDYVVKTVAKSLNSVSLAIAKVDVT